MLVNCFVVKRFDLFDKALNKYCIIIIMYLFNFIKYAYYTKS